MRYFLAIREVPVYAPPPKKNTGTQLLIFLVICGIGYLCENSNSQSKPESTSTTGHRDTRQPPATTAPFEFGQAGSDGR